MSASWRVGGDLRNAGWLRPLYLFHLKVVLPLVERILLRGAQDFAMIGTYSTNFGSAAELAAILREHGLEVEFSKYFFGCATGVAGRKIAPIYGTSG